MTTQEAATFPGFNADSSLDRPQEEYGSFMHAGATGARTSAQWAEVVPALFRDDAGPKPDGNCFMMCEEWKTEPDTTRPRMTKTGRIDYPRRVMVGTGCSWICVPDPF